MPIITIPGLNWGSFYSWQSFFVAKHTAVMFKCRKRSILTKKRKIHPKISTLRVILLPFQSNTYWFDSILYNHPSLMISLMQRRQIYFLIKKMFLFWHEIYLKVWFDIFSISYQGVSLMPLTQRSALFSTSYFFFKNVLTYQIHTKAILIFSKQVSCHPIIYKWRQNLFLVLLEAKTMKRLASIAFS